MAGSDEKGGVEEEHVLDVEAEEAGAGCGVCMITPDFDGLIGIKKYDYRYLCTPSLPWSKGGVEPPMFLGKDDKLPLLLAMIMGLQHSLAMVSGIATSPLLIAGDACFPWQLDSAMCDSQSYLISAGWITSGLLTIVQVFRARLCGSKYFLGTGLISVMGTSFTFLPIARDMVVSEILEAQNEGKCGENNDCVGFGRKGYGKFLGTAMVAAFFEIFLALAPAKVREKFFPPVVTGVAVMLIGGALISAGIKYVGGGVFCAENDLSASASFGGPQLCTENGNVVLPFGAPEYIGLGFSVIAMSVVIQFFGSPFLKSTFFFWGLVFGCFVSGVSTYEAKEGDYTLDGDGNTVPAKPGRQYKYWNDSKIKDANTFVFLWDTTYPLGFAPEYFVPILIGYFVSSAETIGDIAASCVASRIPAYGHNLDARVQGGLLADGFNSILACLFTSPPNTTFSENNGIIALTGCASRAAGFAVSFWLILFGVVGKIGATFNSIPICVVGGVVLQCFAMVFVSGMQIATKNFNRRSAFILMLSLGLGLGVAMEPNLFEGGSGFSFFAQNLNHNYGFWPKHKTCKEFPRVDVVTEISPPFCTVQNFTWSSDDDTFEADCANLSGNFEPQVTVTTSEKVKDCVDDNGFCCVKYDKTKKSNRTTAIIILKTPYCLGFMIAVLLHLSLPEDRLPDVEEIEVVGTAEPIQQGEQKDEDSIHGK